jgi:hypothetical protein
VIQKFFNIDYHFNIQYKIQFQETMRRQLAGPTSSSRFAKKKKKKKKKKRKIHLSH